MNRLGMETSPYLKQHERNPVDWFPWSEEALLKAKQEDRPILLSVGYSSCHWCHVMAHECFENETIAKLINEHFICIKVDREERPDLDLIYQPVAQLFTRSGGWPLTVFLTPELKPFYGGTYFPPADRYGRPGFPKVLSALSKSYRENRAEVELRAEKITEAIRSGSESGISSEIGSAEPLSSFQIREGLIQASETLVEYIDREHGGIGAAPKFPNTPALTFLWRMSRLSWVPELDRKRFREGVWHTLDSMVRGGIFDQIAGGFHRYSVDAEWVIPHFEKMLYDNGLLLKLYSEVLTGSQEDLSAERKQLYRNGIHKTVQWLQSEMKSLDGGFYSALDADSLADSGNHEEGAFYTWSAEEFEKIPSRSQEEKTIFEKMLTGLTEESRHVLTLQKLGPEETNSAHYLQLIDHLKAIRSTRVRPGLDDKILIAWNSLVISGFSWASLAFELLNEEEEMEKTKALAIQTWNALKKKALRNGVLYSTLQKGEPKFPAYLDDEAFFLQATLDLARADWKKSEAYLKEVESRLESVIERFHDPQGQGFFFTGSRAELIHRPKTYFDQATPSGNGVMLGVMAMLESAHPALEFHHLIRSEEMNLFQNGFGMAEVLNALLLNSVGPVKVEGKPDLGIRSHPFCFWIREPGLESQHQYCYSQTCYSGTFSPESHF